MAYYHNDTIIYLNGAYVKAAEATTDFFGQSLHYGYVVFEGIRSYQTASGETKIFKAVEHYDRLKDAALALNRAYTWDTAELAEATYEVLSQNNLKHAYIRPVVYAPPNLSFNPNKEPYIMIAA